jgi:cytosine deaminase
MDLLVRNVRTIASRQLTDIGVEKGKISVITKPILGRANVEIDGRGGLVLPTFVEPHVHLDKAFLGERVREAKSISDARKIVRKAKEDFSVSDVKKRARRAIDAALSSGVTAVRTHVDVDPAVGLKSVKALVELRAEFKDSLTLQIVAFPQSGLAQEVGVEELLLKALEIGADVLGGIPEAETTKKRGYSQINKLLEIASEKDVDLDIHCDVIPTTNYVKYYAKQVIKHNFHGRATASHLIALSFAPNSEAKNVVRLLRKARMNVVSCPCTMMISGASNHQPLGRGVTRIQEILHAGINLAYGLDNIVDPYNPFGDFDPLRNGWLFAYQGQLRSRRDMKSILKMPTYNSARILRLQRYGLRRGCNADFNVLDAESPREALRRKTSALFVVKAGTLRSRGPRTSVT